MDDQKQPMLPAKISDVAQFPVLNLPADQFKDKFEVIKENLGNRHIGALDLERIKIPAGGGKLWELTTIDGEPGASTEWFGTIVAWRDVRVFWHGAYSGGGSGPPDCQSDGAITGRGEPGGPCADCPFAKFDTAVKSDGTKGRGQACQQKIQIFALTAESWLPTVLSVPCTSITHVRHYMTRLATRAIPFYGVMTKFTLLPDKSSDGYDFSAAVLSVASMLEPGQKDRAKAYSKQFAPFMGNFAVADDEQAPEPAPDAKPETAPEAEPVQDDEDNLPHIDEA